MSFNLVVKFIKHFVENVLDCPSGTVVQIFIVDLLFSYGLTWFWWVVVLLLYFWFFFGRWFLQLILLQLHELLLLVYWSLLLFNHLSILLIFFIEDFDAQIIIFTKLPDIHLDFLLHLEENYNSSCLATALLPPYPLLQLLQLLTVNIHLLLRLDLSILAGKLSYLKV